MARAPETEIQPVMTYRPHCGKLDFLCRPVLFLAIALAVQATAGAEGDASWGRSLGERGTDSGYSVAMDEQGNTYTTGQYSATREVDFEGPGTSYYFTKNAFIQKLDKLGSLVWLRRLDRSQGNYIAIDCQGNVYVVGTFTSTVDFDPGAGEFMMTSSGDEDVFIIKLDSEGHFEWASQVGGTWRDIGMAIAVDYEGAVYSCGIVGDGADVDPGPGTITFERRSYIQKLDADGNLMWVKQVASGGAEVTCLTLDSQGNIFTTGVFLGSQDFDPGPNLRRLVAPPSDQFVQQAFVQSLDTSGNFRWAHSIGGLLYDIGYGIAADSEGNVLVTGGFLRTVDFDPGPAEALLGPTSSYDAFILSFSNSGEFRWVSSIAGPSQDYGYGIKCDGWGNSYVTGRNSGSADIISPGKEPVLNSIEDSGMFVVKFGAAGEHIWSRRFGGATLEQVYDIAVNRGGDIAVTGYFEDTIELGLASDGPGLVSEGDKDIFLYRLAGETPNEPFGIDLCGIWTHSTDVNRDNAFSFSELLRLIQFFNTGGFHCDTSGETEDGFSPGSEGSRDCFPHDSDFLQQDWQINISELIRAISIYNSSGYRYCPTENPEDFFCLK